MPTSHPPAIRIAGLRKSFKDNHVPQGTTIFPATQYLEEADQLASRVAVIDGGSIIADGAPTELKRRVGSGHLVLELPTPDALAGASKGTEDHV